MNLVVTAGIDEQRRPRLERFAGVAGRRRDGPELAQGAERRHRENQIVCELVERALDAEVGIEREREDDRVGRHVATGMVADEQHRPGVGDVPESANLAAEPDAGDQPHQRQPLADEVRIALVEIGPRDPSLGLLRDAAQHPREHRALVGARRGWLGRPSVAARLR